MKRRGYKDSRYQESSSTRHKSSKNRSKRRRTYSGGYKSDKYNNGYNNVGDENRRNVKSKTSSTSHRSHQSRSHSEKENHKIKNDDRGHLMYATNDILYSRYRIISLLGEGTFGRCFKCFDKRRNEELAVKVVRNNEKYRESALIEIDILKAIRNRHSKRSSLCVEMISWFEYGGHVCIVFPLLGASVYDFIKKNDHSPFTFSQILHISFQMLDALSYLHSLKITHTDLKPENMLFVDSAYEIWDNSGSKYNNILRTDIRIIDFGSAVFQHDHHSRVVCTRHYRPPEVVLEIGWNYAVDLWSAGCIIYELYKGVPLFMTHDNHEHLVMMEVMLGQIPDSLISQTKKRKYFKDGKLKMKGRNVDSKYVNDNCFPLKETFVVKDPNHYELYKLVSSLLRYDSSKRISARAASAYPLFSQFYSESKSDRTY